MKRIFGSLVALLIAGLTPIVAIADDVSNNLDPTVDVNLETMALTTGGSDGSVTYRLIARQSDGDPACNLDGPSEFVTFNVVVADTSKATASASTITFNGPTCNSTQTTSMHPVAAGSTDVTLTLASTNSGAGTFNTAPAAFTVNVTAPADSTPPVITSNVTPAANTNGWHNSNVNVSWTVTDPESSISSSSGCGPTILTSETAGTTLTCTATSAGGTTSESVTIKIDKTAPTASASASPAANANGWNNSDVTVHFGGTDALSGIDSCDPDVVLSSEGVGQSASGTCTDKAGNPSTSATADGINIDKTNPDVTITTPADSAHYTFHQVVLANWGTTDTLSGIETASGTTASGSPIDTSSLEVKSYSVTATDMAGNTTTQVVSYTVDPYVFSNFLAPLNLDAKFFKKNSTIPVKFNLKDVNGNPITNASAQLYVDDVAAVASGSSNTANNFRYDVTGQQYIYNLSTKMPLITAPGTHTLRVHLDDGSDYTITITVK